MNKKVLSILLILLLAVASLAGCTGDEDDGKDGNGGDGNGDAGCTGDEDDGKDGNGGDGNGDGNGNGGGFKIYEFTSDWTDANENANPLTGLEAITLAVDNINVVAPGGTYILSTSTELGGTGADKATGKAVAWQMYFHKSEGGSVMNRIVNIAPKGAVVVKDYYESSGMDAWDYASAVIDTDELPAIATGHHETVDWLAAHTGAVVDIQTSSGPFGGPDETSWLLWYKDGSDSHQVYISANDGQILE
jgi:hypothetical protein